jgi:hypothetical protein
MGEEANAPIVRSGYFARNQATTVPVIVPPLIIQGLYNVTPKS